MTGRADVTAATRMPRGADLVQTFAHSHPRRTVTVCPGWEKDRTRTGLNKLVDTFESCSCPSSPFTLLMEQIWRRACRAVAGEGQEGR